MKKFYKLAIGMGVALMIGVMACTSTPEPETEPATINIGGYTDRVRCKYTPEVIEARIAQGYEFVAAIGECEVPVHWVTLVWEKE